MSRTLGIDYGTSRIGLALSDDSGTMAFPHATIDGSGDLIENIRTLCEREGVGQVVVGLPQALGSMSDTAMTVRVRIFAESLQKLGLPVEFEPELLSTDEAKESGATKKEHIDASAATIILQSYLEGKKNMIQ